MVLSIWRYSHLVLALSSALFLLTAAITGIVLSFSPIKNQISNYHNEGLDQISLSELIVNISMNNKEILEISIDKNNFVVVKAIKKSGEMSSFYVNISNGENLGKIKKESAIFSLFRNIHRSLLLKKTGRVIVGIVSLLLLLLAFSGTILIVKRQLSIKRFYSKVIFDDFYQFWHIINGRLSLFIIIIVAFSGTFMSFERFDLISPKKIEHNINYQKIKEKSRLNFSEFEIFKKTKLSELTLLQFPFSPFKEDQFKLRLKNKELVINQYNGKILSSINFGFFSKFSDLNYRLHTGVGSITWSIILCVSCFSILFFIFSGFKISLKRRKFKTKVNTNENEESYLILVGSENGNTNRFSKKLYDILKANKISVSLDHLNNYKPIKNLKQLIVVTSTYGLGQPPSNAKKFISKFKKYPIKKPYEFAVLGFGSRNYPDFCQFAIDVNEEISNDKNAKNILPLKLINNQSQSEFENWLKSWGNINNIDMSIQIENNLEKDLFKVISKTNADKDPNSNFTLLLKSLQLKTFQSGDLLAIKPTNDEEERSYSIAKTLDNEIFLSLRKHENGKCSSYLDGLKVKDNVRGRIIKNINFRIPDNFERLILISNGTGIAPLLGMAYENDDCKEIDLIWGAKYSKTLKLFRTIINYLIDEERLTSFEVGYSKDAKYPKKYVQDIIIENKSSLFKNFNEKSFVMICGSIEMGNDVIKLINDILIEYGKKSLNHYIDNEQIKIDTY